MSKKDKKITEQKPVKDAPKKDPQGRNLTAESVTSKGTPDGPDKKTVKATVAGITVEAVDDDGAGMARVLSTLAAMVPD